MWKHDFDLNPYQGGFSNCLAEYFIFRGFIQCDFQRTSYLPSFEFLVETSVSLFLPQNAIYAFPLFLSKPLYEENFSFLCVLQYFDYIHEYL